MSNGNLFTFGYYGYTIHSATDVHFTGHAALSHLLAQDAVDGVGSPLLYRSTARGPSGATITHGPWDAPSVRGKMWVVEADLRTPLSPDTPSYARFRFGTDTLKGTCDVLQR